MEKNKVKLTICGAEYIIGSDEDSKYMIELEKSPADYGGALYRTFYQSSFSSLIFSTISSGIASPWRTTRMQRVERMKAIGQ